MAAPRTPGAWPGLTSPRTPGSGAGTFALPDHRLDLSAVPSSSLSNIRLISGSSSGDLAAEVAARLGVPLSPANVKRFNDGEVQIQLAVRPEAAVFVVQSLAPPVNDALIELLLLLSAARRASAESVTAVVPYCVRPVLAPAEPIQGFFSPRCPVDNVYAAPAATAYFHSKRLDAPVVVSPDAAGVPRAKLFAEGLGLYGDDAASAIAVVVAVEKRLTLVGDVAGKDCVIVDDLVDSGSTLVGAADHLRAAGARRVFAFVTHGIFSGDAPDRVEASALEEVLVANTIPLRPDVKARTKKIRALSVGKLVESAIRAIHGGVSVSALFETNLAGAQVC
ncbi:ribose phosphate diphosphokinase [Aureococcus anophagefferens]|nr:ribose phosphate diphosphokinase [Aureococcus anophagefferens]